MVRGIGRIKGGVSCITLSCKLTKNIGENDSLGINSKLAAGRHLSIKIRLFGRTTQEDANSLTLSEGLTFICKSRLVQDTNSS